MKKIHFIGIGGIGMSALARYYLSLGFEVSGSDANKSDLLDALVGEGMIIAIGSNAQNIPSNVSKIIYTIAIPEDNSELVKAKELVINSGVELLTYPQALGEMTNDKKVIAVCGTHGKTTTTAMTYYALKNAGLDVSMIVGSLIDVDGKKTNYTPPNLPLSRGGTEQDNWMIIEACEYRRSFLNYNPDIILVTNIDNDHLDYFKNETDTRSAFQEFVNKIKTPPSLVSALSVPSPLIKGRNSAALIIHEVEDFLHAPDGVQKINCEEFSNESEIELNVPGVHNRKNAQLVIALGEFLAEKLDLDKNKIKEGLKNFKGTWRRQEYKGNYFGADFYDDYAHHPTEIKATLQAFREKFPDRKIIAIFQPHLFSRTRLLFTDFVNSFSDADKVILLPIYASREKFDETINSEMLAEGLNNIGKKAQVVEKDNLHELLVNSLQPGEVVITLGAGDIYDIYKKLSIKN